MTKKGQKFGLKMGNFFGLCLKKDHRKKFRVENRKFFGRYLKKQVIGNLVYPEMLFTKKALYIYIYTYVILYKYIMCAYLHMDACRPMNMYVLYPELYGF